MVYIALFYPQFVQQTYISRRHFAMSQNDRKNLLRREIKTWRRTDVKTLFIIKALGIFTMEWSELCNTLFLECLAGYIQRQADILELQYLRIQTQKAIHAHSKRWEVLYCEGRGNRTCPIRWRDACIVGTVFWNFQPWNSN